MTTLEQIDPTRVPQHVAIIMDGNGRWAMRQQQQRIFGHQNAFTAVRQAVEAAVQTGVRYLTLYTFSTENWNRPSDEVDGLMALLIKAVEEETKTLLDNNVRLTTIGQFDRIPQASRQMLERCIHDTAGGTALTLILALSYSSRWEIGQALQRICANPPLTFDDNTIRSYLATAPYPDPDLMIRTGGEQRISNFLLWQMAYTELYFTDLLWPDFRHEDFYRAILDYQQRQRRFGKTEAQIEAEQ